MPATKKVLDFTNVTDRQFNPKHLPAGDYRARIKKVDDAKSNAGNDMWVYTIAIEKGPGKGASFPYYCTLDPKSLWKVRALYVAAGFKVGKKKINLDPNKVVGMEIGITLDDDEYEGKMKSVIVTTLPLDEMGATPAADDDADEDDDEVETADDDDEELEEVDIDEV